MDAHLPKPFHDAQLTHVLTRHLRAGRTAFPA
jgi:hypothetical protein